MPNWCRNRVNVYSENATDIKKIKAIFESKTGAFNEIIPSPDWDNTPNEDGELPVKKEHKRPDGTVSFVTTEFPSGKQDARWYDWNLANWDTKWDVFPDGIEIDYDDAYGDELEIEFQTAWSPPEAVCRALRDQFPNVDISWFYDEPGMEVAGYL